MSENRYSELVPGYELPTLHLTAKVLRPFPAGYIDSHDDSTMSRIGFRGGLVNGQVVYSYLSQGLVGYFGAGWLGSGSAEVRFVRPFYEGEQVTCAYTVAGRETNPEGERIVLELVARNSEGVYCATGSASYPLSGTPDLEEEPFFVAAGRRKDRQTVPPLAPGKVALNMPFEPRVIEDSAGENAAYIARIGDPLPIYERFIHPGLLSGWGAGMIREARTGIDLPSLGPQVQVSYTIENFRPALVGRRYTLYGAFTEAFSKKGNDFHSVDSLIFDDADACVARVRVTTMYHLARWNEHQSGSEK